MAKPRHPDNRPDTSEGAGEGGVEAGAAEAEAEDRWGKQGPKDAYQPHPWKRTDQTKEINEATGSGEDTEAEEEGQEDDHDREVETPRGATVEAIRVGRDLPPPGGKHGPPGIYLRPCAPVVAGSLRILSTSQ